MKKHLLIFLLLLVLSCKKEVPQKSVVLKDLYLQFKDGEIIQAKYKGETVYLTGLNLYDAGTSLYDQNGNIIGACDYAYHILDPICYELTELKDIYRCKNHITGKPAVDSYNLASE